MCVGIANYALAVMHGVEAFAHMLRERQHDTLRAVCLDKFNFRSSVETTPARAGHLRLKPLLPQQLLFLGVIFSLGDGALVQQFFELDQFIGHTYVWRGL